MNGKRFGKKIRQKRQECGYTLDQLADLCHINSGYLKQIENGSKIPAFPLLIILCEKLNTSPNYLCEFAEEVKVQNILDKCYCLSPDELVVADQILDVFINFRIGQKGNGI